MNLKKIGTVFTSKFVRTGPSSYKKRIYQATVSQRLRNTGLRLRIFLMFSTTRVVGRQPYAPATFTPGEIPGTHFQRLSRPQGTWFRRGEPRKKSPVTPPGNRSWDRPTSSAVP